MNRRNIWTIQASIMGTCVFVALAVGILIAPGTLAPKPLDVAAPATADSLRTSIDALSRVLDDSEGKTDQDTGVGATISDEPPTTGAQVYDQTWLDPADATVTEVKDQVARCRTLIEPAEAVLDPDKTRVGRSDQADPDATPRIITLGQIAGMSSDLDACADQVNRAVTAMDDALEEAKTAAADPIAVNANAAARTSLPPVISAAQITLRTTTSDAAVADLRAALSTHLDTATTLINTEPPTGWQKLDEQTAALIQVEQDLSETTQAIRAIHVYTGGNGDIDPDNLCEVPYDPKQLLRCNAEAAWMRLNEVYKGVWGENIPIDLSYRTYDEQVQMRAEYGSGAAVPGTSNHGLGTAVDLPDYRETVEGLEWNYGTPKYEWMKANAPAYGWINPSWAVEGGVGPHEPWHFEYVGG